MQYHSSSSAYLTSYIKTTVDAWKTAKAPLVIEAKLITVDEVASLGYEYVEHVSSHSYENTESTPNWLYSSDWIYWLCSPCDDSEHDVWIVGQTGKITCIMRLIQVSRFVQL